MSKRSILGKICIVVFVLFNILMLCVAGLLYGLQDVPPEDIRTEIMGELTDLGKESVERELTEKDEQDLSQATDEIMTLIVAVQEKGLRVAIFMWIMGGAVTGLAVYFTRPRLY